MENRNILLIFSTNQKIKVMLVKELIQKLQEFNPDSKIAFHSCIECGMSTVVSEGGEMTLDYDEENDEVFLEVSGEETDWS